MSESTAYQASAPSQNTPNTGTRVSTYYAADEKNFVAPPKVTGKDGVVSEGNNRKGRPSIFNRYSVFFVNQQISGAEKSEEYFDKIGRIGDEALARVRVEPTASNLIQWSREDKTNAVEFAWEDFLWCKNYGNVPNNYMVTLRRFTVPPEDDLFDVKKNVNPDIARMITWVDGETNKWDSVGLKWTHNLQWKPLEAEIQDVESQPGYGNEAGALSGLPGGNMIKGLASVMDTPASKAAASDNPNSHSAEAMGYNNSSVVFGPIDSIKRVMIREKGLEFAQTCTLVFEYELRSIDGINPKVAMLDLLSNVMICTMNKGAFWGGDIRHYGGNPRRLKPIGKPELLASGDYGGYLKSLVGGIVGKLDDLSGGKGIDSFQGAVNAAKGMAGNLLSQIAGGALDKMGRPGISAINSLLTGESTGEWHITIGNPANPILTVGNMILKKTDVELFGPLGYDDFPTKLKVTCELEPARPRDRIDIMGMFSRNTRMYLTEPPKVAKYSGNVKSGGKNGGKTPGGNHVDTLSQVNWDATTFGEIKERFPNHFPANIEHSAKHIF